MGRKIIIYKNKPYSNFKLFCEIYGIKYNTYNRKSFPIEFKGDYIHKELLIQNKSTSMELVKITEENGKQLVSARELYIFLGLDLTQWAKWAFTNIVKDSSLIDNVDYTRVVILVNYQPVIDYAITLDMAKGLSMVARNEKGKEVRNYFIAMEK